jgi:hypothetical protein
MAGPAYIKGDFWRICEECGFKKRASETLKRWDGLYVCREDFEERHPQDFVSGVVDRQTVPDPRPEAVDGFTGPLTTTTTAAALPGAVLISVASSARFSPTDTVGILLDGGDEHRSVLLDVPTSTSIQLITALPSGVSVGNSVINYSAVSTPSL